MVSDEEDIMQSLEILFSTSIGERFLEPGYGSDLHDYLFEALDTSTQSLLEDRLRAAILYHEPRIELLQVAVFVDEPSIGNTLRISVDFAIRGTNSRYNRVFPFYMEEGTLLPAGNPL